MTEKTSTTGRPTTRRRPAAKRAATTKPAPTKPAPTVKAKPPSKKEKLAAELVVEVKALRSSLDETVEQLRVRIGAQLAQLEDVAAGKVKAGAKPIPPNAKTASAMLKQVRALKIKPKKGRIKDLNRLADLVEDLLDHLPPQP